MQRAGFVLTGGHSTRMGRDKALLPHRSHSLVENVAAAVKQAAGSVTLVGRPADYRHLGLPCLKDEVAGFGPLSGLHAALGSRSAEYNLILACDMPGLHASLLSLLLKTAEETGARCVAAQDASGQLHPLCAVYRANALENIEQQIEQRHLRLTDLLLVLDVIAVKTELSIANCNTPDEWAAVQ